MKLQQVSVFVENAPGSLYGIIKILGDNNIDIKALSIADTKDYGILRIIVDKPKLALELLKGNYVVKVTDVIAISISNEPGALIKALELLKNANIAIDYLYAFVGSIERNASVMLKVDDDVKAIEILNENGIKLLEPSSIIKED